MDLARIRKKKLQVHTGSGAGTAAAAQPVAPPAEPPLERVPQRTPLEIILSGRELAGCGDEPVRSDEPGAVEGAGETVDFLRCRIAGELYGIDIMAIKEIIRPREVTEVPRSPSFVPGVLSLRGTIIPIIDMALRLGHPRSAQSSRERIVVIRRHTSFAGLLVDEVTGVGRLNKSAVEPVPMLREGPDRDFVTGVGRSSGHMVILLNLDMVSDITLH